MGEQLVADTLKEYYLLIHPVDHWNIHSDLGESPGDYGGGSILKDDALHDFFYITFLKPQKLH